LQTSNPPELHWKFSLSAFSKSYLRSKNSLQIDIFNSNWDIISREINSPHSEILVEIQKQLEKSNVEMVQQNLGYAAIMESVVKVHKQTRGSLSEWRQTKRGNLILERQEFRCVVSGGKFSFSRDHYPSSTFLLRETYCFAKERVACFVVVVPKNKQVFTFYATSAKERQEWIDVCLINGADSKEALVGKYHN